MKGRRDIWLLWREKRDDDSNHEKAAEVNGKRKRWLVIVGRGEQGEARLREKRTGRHCLE